nr:hypothetical protein [Candidatus Aenigmarchaeota archaeon]
MIPNGLPAEQYQVILDYARMYPDDIISIPDSPFQLEIKGSEVLDLKKEEFESLLIENMVKKIQEGRIDEFFT